jgi:hypothetical protein
MDEFLRAYCNKDETNKEGCKRSQGLTMSHSGDLEIPTGFKEQVHWGDGQFRTVWINDKDLTTITYCEGDIIVMQHHTQASYDREIVKAAEFYEAERKGGDMKMQTSNIFWSNIDIFGQKAFVCDFRIPAETKKPELFYYGIRNSDEDLGRPSTIEEQVIVNHWGTLVTTKELDFRGLDYIALNDRQIELIMESEEA